jgi:hypothetical protein
MADTQYTFDTQSNSYFNGRDLRVTDAIGNTIVLNERESMCAVNVKDETPRQQWPDAARAAAEKIGDAALERIYDEVKGEFWAWAKDAAERFDFPNIYQEGRDGGWLAVDGTEELTGALIIDPGDDEDMRDLRDRFLAFAFEVEGSIDDGWRQEFYGKLEAAAAEKQAADNGSAASPAGPNPDHYEVYAETELIWIGAALYTDDAIYIPIATADGQMGYAINAPSGGRQEFLYFNPSTDTDDGKPNVFVYGGEACNPDNDEPFNHYTVLEDD